MDILLLYGHINWIFEWSVLVTKKKKKKSGISSVFYSQRDPKYLVC